MGEKRAVHVPDPENCCCDQCKLLRIASTVRMPMDKIYDIGRYNVITGTPAVVPSHESIQEYVARLEQEEREAEERLYQENLEAFEKELNGD